MWSCLSAFIATESQTIRGVTFSHTHSNNFRSCVNNTFLTNKMRTHRMHANIMQKDIQFVELLTRRNFTKKLFLCVCVCVCVRTTDIERISQNSFTAACNGVVSHWAPTGYSGFRWPHTRKRTQTKCLPFAFHAAFHTCLSSGIQFKVATPTRAKWGWKITHIFAIPYLIAPA